MVVSGAMGGSASDGTLVATFGTGGVQQPTEPVTEISSGLLDKLLGGVGSLGDLGGFGRGGTNPLATYQCEQVLTLEKLPWVKLGEPKIHYPILK